MRLIPSLIIASIGLPLHAASLTLDTERAQMSYSTGHQIGSNLKRQGVDLDADMLKQGIQDALAGSAARMTEPEMDKARAELRRQSQAAQQAKAEKAAEAKLTAGRAFLEENGKKAGVVALPSGLQYRVIKAGEGKKPVAVDQVTVHYRGTLLDGSEFDSSYRRNQPASFPLNGVIAGWTEGLQLMREGAKYEFYIPPSLAYGERGRLAHETLIFEVELISVQAASVPKAAN
ncbi:MAG: hypothetical protein B7Y41_03605 [Hydrogenophilales bacterium 28-61-23]|nr:MAG: hypothetical protein B7Y41_03605 [Hydrogenophilales bacterium 28-61-23]